MDLYWHYKRTEPFISQGTDTTRANFSREDRSTLGILVRESLQNPLDAPRDDLQGPIRVGVKRLGPGEFDVAYLNRVFNQEFRGRVKAACEVDLPPDDEAEVLVIEDFGTKGLIGNFVDFDADGHLENWNAFWHRIGQPSKQGASNGGAGQGKITFYDHSLARTVLVLTRRSTDSQELLMGRAFFSQDYRYNNYKYVKEAFWTTSTTIPEPEKNSQPLQQFSAAFKLTRTPSDSGLSLVIPFAKQFDPKEAMKSVILDFYMPIVNKKLEVIIDNKTLSSATIDAIADSLLNDDEVHKLKSAFTKGYRAFVSGVINSTFVKLTQVTLGTGWNNERLIPEQAFPEGSLEKLRTSLEAGSCIAISLPLKLKKKMGSEFNTNFEVYIEAPPDLEHVEEAFVRRDLVIGSEKHLSAGLSVQKTRSLTWIKDNYLSEFLLSCEEPTHLVWNASKARHEGKYVSSDLALRSIRQAVPRLLAVLLGSAGQRDVKALAKFFTKPALEKTKRTGDLARRKAGDKTQIPPEVIPPPKLKPFCFDISIAAIKVMAVPRCKLDPAHLPLRATLEFAYEAVGSDPFDEYDPHDFDLNDAVTFPITTKGIKLVSRTNNRLVIDVVNPDFSLKISGFSQYYRTRARLDYTSKPEDEEEEQPESSDPEGTGKGEVVNA